MAVMSDAERQKIQREAQDILKRFSTALAAVKVPSSRAHSGEAGYREEGKGSSGDAAFRKAMFANAPSHDEDSLLAEKKLW